MNTQYKLCWRHLFTGVPGSIGPLDKDHAESLLETMKRDHNEYEYWLEVW